MADGTQQTLNRGLNAVQVQLISLGGIIGSCYFLGIGDSIAAVGPATVLSLMLGGLIVWLVANGMGELCVALPRAGSFVSYASELVGRPWAAGVGWSYWLNWCAYVPSEMIAGGLIMNHFVPSASAMTWAVLFGLLITAVNISSVKSFGYIESTLAMIKVTAIIAFCGAAFLIWVGRIGGAGFLGAKVLTSGQGLAGIFPAGVLVVLQRMVMILVNYQGTEIVALAAAETSNPEKNIPVAIKNVAVRIVALFVIPVLLLVMIFPYREAGISGSVFAATLERYGFRWAGGVFSFVVLFAALSCANSGMYGTVRSLYALSREGLAPEWLGRLNRRAVPAHATYLTIAVCWSFIPLFTLFKETSFYTWLLSVSGFTGALCWISISWCQLRFRRRLLARGYQRRDLVFAAPGFPLLSYFAIWVQVACLVFVAWHPSLRSCLIIGLPAAIIPMLVSWALIRNGRLRRPPLGEGEKSFDDAFPSPAATIR